MNFVWPQNSKKKEKISEGSLRGVRLSEKSFKEFY